MKERENIIGDYVEAYNNFNIEKMVADFHESIVFENISDGTKNMSLIGLTSFKEQAEQANLLFSKRNQTITAFHYKDDEIEIEIDYHAVLATDLPNGFKKGDEINLQGKSIFKFSGNKIIALTDIS